MSQSAAAASDLTTEYTAYPAKLNFSVYAERYAVQDGEYLYFTLPRGLAASLLSYRSRERTLPLAWTNDTDSIMETNIILPDGYEPIILPGNFSWQAPEGAGMIEIAVDYSRRANALRIVEMTDLKPALIPADDFQDIIDAASILAHPDRRTILLKRKN